MNMMNVTGKGKNAAAKLRPEPGTITIIAGLTEPSSLPPSPVHHISKIKESKKFPALQ